MSEALQQQLAKVLEAMLAAAQSGATWVGEQLPPLVQEIVVLGRLKASFAMAQDLLCVGLALVWGLKVMPWLIKKVDQTHNGDEDVYVGFTIVGTMAALFLFVWGIVGFSADANTLFTAWVAPRLYLIEYLKGLLK